MSITITPTASGAYWQDAAGNEYVRLDVMRQQMKTQDTIAKADRENAQVAIKQARIDAAWEKQRGDRYRARALALMKQARRWRAVIANERGIRAMQRDITRGHMDRAEKAERERATADRLRLEALQEVERLKAFARQVESIMDSICGAQAFNFSEHAYPLRAALDAAGFPGRGYEEARAGLGTLIENVKALELDNERLRARVAELEPRPAQVQGCGGPDPGAIT
jgi:hypothetical protein